MSTSSPSFARFGAALRSPQSSASSPRLFLVVALLVSVLWAPTRAIADVGPCGDVNGSGSLTSADALLALKGAVGQDVNLTCPLPAMPLKTGQTNCYDEAGAQVSCAGTKQDGDVRPGVEHSFVDNGDGTITDEATGLVWEKLSQDSSIHDYENGYRWAEAFGEKIATLNAQQYAGYSDWRLPNRFELESLVDLGAFEPAMSAFFDNNCVFPCTVLTCSCPSSATFWSSTSAHGFTDMAWTVRFDDGFADRLSKDSILSVRAVRGGF